MRCWDRRPVGSAHRAEDGPAAGECRIGALLLVLAGLSCGGGAGTTPAGPSPAPTTPTTPTTPTPSAGPAPQPLPGSPCPGVVIRGEPPRAVESVTRAELLIEWEPGAEGGFDWGGPYYDDAPDPENRYVYPLLEVNVAEWRVETLGGTTRHWLSLEWPTFAEVRLLFRSEADCELPTLVCGTAVCQLEPES